MSKKHVLTVISLGLLGSAALAQPVPVGTAFTYQGRLVEGGQPASGWYAMSFTLWDAGTNGHSLGQPQLEDRVAVSNGLFTVTLDFGVDPLGRSYFRGDARWLEIGVDHYKGTNYVTLVPRQPLTPTPYAFYAPAAGSVPASGLTGTVPDARLSDNVALLDSSPTFTGTVQAAQFQGGGAGLTGLSANQLATGTVPDARLAASVARTDQVWLLNGNAGTTAGTHFLGTTDNEPLELKVKNQRGLRLEPTAYANTVNVIGGSAYNNVGASVVGATIFGGGSSIVGTHINQVDARFGTVSGGGQNAIQINATFATIAGGSGNTIQTNAYQATIGGGSGNTIQPDAANATIGGGIDNTIQTSAHMATIGGGNDNTIQTNAYQATIGGGNDNTIQTNAHSATIGGGNDNTIQTNAYSATIGGGAYNTIQTNAANATIGGGASNTIQTDAYNATIGGGSRNTIQPDAAYTTIAGGDGNTIQPDASYATIGGGSGNTIQTNADYATIPGGRSNEATNYAFAAGYDAHARHTGAFVWSDGAGTDTVSTNANSVTMRARGGYRLMTSSANNVGAYLASGSSTWTVLSDRNAKENFEAVNPREVLDKVAALPVSRWNYKTQPASVRHVGPMAQDFQAAFAVGESDTGITTVDADGVALAAIQGLNQKLESENQSVRSALVTKDAEIAELQKRLAALEQFIKHQTK